MLRHQSVRWIWAAHRASWPSELGNPASTGAQNNLQYACFPVLRRLAIRHGGRVSVYDTRANTGYSGLLPTVGRRSVSHLHQPVRPGPRR